jgi:peptidyl-prolyl cis-trans isomerase-like 4
MSVLVETSLGDLIIDVFDECAPTASLNFVKLCKLHYYDGLQFYRVQRDYIVECGDPRHSKRGVRRRKSFENETSIYGLQADGAASKYFDDEQTPLRHRKLGTVAMANVKRNENGSKFYVSTREQLNSLDGKHTVFGHVAEGFDVLQRINNVLVDDNGVPLESVHIVRAIVLHDPFDDVAGMPNPDDCVPLLSVGAETSSSSSAIDDSEPVGLEAQREREEAARERMRAEILAGLGDLPSVDVAPPENVLFVCKLNPVTRSEDLELIFSRFGNIVNCNVVRDKSTGASLNYAFVGFEHRQSAEAAYLKMDNVLVDNHRIHVDFSQSVRHTNKRFRRR